MAKKAFESLTETRMEDKKRTYCITEKGIDLYKKETQRLRACIADGESEGM